MTRFIGTAIIFGILALGANLDRDPETYVDLPSLVFIAAVVAGGLLLSFRLTDLKIAIRVTAGRPAGAKDLNTALGVVLRTRELTLCGGLIGSMFGLISMLTTMLDPGTFPPTIALALLCPFYAIVLNYLLLGSATASLKLRQNAVNESQRAYIVEPSVPENSSAGQPVTSGASLA